MALGAQSRGRAALRALGGRPVVSVFSGFLSGELKYALELLKPSALGTWHYPNNNNADTIFAIGHRADGALRPQATGSVGICA